MPEPPQPSPTLLAQIGEAVLSVQHALIDLLHPAPPLPLDVPPLADVIARSRQRTDISDHLPLIFSEALGVQPKLIVELGVRGGESTFVLERVAELAGNIPLVSVDIDDCSAISDYANWHFIQGDDIELAGRFSAWLEQKGFPPRADFLFLDTSHLFEHTLAELEHWLPFVAPGGKIALHDTNQRRLYKRRDGSRGIGWSNRGVIAAMEKYFGRSFPERKDFVDMFGEWLAVHHAHCNGLTVMTRLTPAE